MLGAVQLPYPAAQHWVRGGEVVPLLLASQPSNNRQNNWVGIDGQVAALGLRPARTANCLALRLCVSAGRSPAERDRLLHTVVVGGGPTGVEFAGELADFINRDLQKIDPDRARDMRVSWVVI